MFIPCFLRKRKGSKKEIDAEMEKQTFKYILKYLNILRDIKDSSGYVIEIKRHAFVRALERQVTPDMIEATLKGGKRERFGKNYLRFSMDYKRFKVVCVDHVVGNLIRILTVETKRR